MSTIQGSASERAKGWGAIWAKSGHLAPYCYHMLSASSFDGASRSLNSTLYRWDAEGDRFVLHQDGARRQRAPSQRSEACFC